MTDIRIVCTHDALSFAETLKRLLAAEEHRVQLHYGRQSLNELDAAKASRDAVILIWSSDARSQFYMLEWLRNADPVRLIEIARAPDAPASANRKSPVIDFTTWRGVRGTRCWSALSERLRAVARANEPQKPPKRAAIALGMASMAAVTGALFVRADQQQASPMQAEPAFSVAPPAREMGGPLLAIEPASTEESIAVTPVGRAPGIELTQVDLPEAAALADPDLRQPSLMERISDMNPLRDPQ